MWLKILFVRLYRLADEVASSKKFILVRPPEAAKPHHRASGIFDKAAYSTGGKEKHSIWTKKSKSIIYLIIQ
jgi:hypothetical protein